MDLLSPLALRSFTCIPVGVLLHAALLLVALGVRTICVARYVWFAVPVIATPARWLDVEGSTFTNNVALNGSGGALHVDVTTAFQGAAGMSNGDGSSIVGTSSAMLPQLLLSLSNSVFSGNAANGTAPTDGGGACSLAVSAGGRSGNGATSISGSGGSGSGGGVDLGGVHMTACNFTSNSARGDGGALLLTLQGGRSGAGGCGWTAEQQSPGVHVTSVRAVGNAAGGHGGALAIMQLNLQAQHADNCSSGAGTTEVTLRGCVLDENVAADSGGGMYVYGRFGVGIEGTHVWGNAAAGGPGGGVAVVGCSQLALSNSSANGNGAAAGGGGGVFAGGCGRVLLSQSELVGNRALAGGALHVTAGAAAGTALERLQVLQQGAGGSSAALLPYNHTAVLVDQARFSNNTALDEGQVSGEEGRGGAVYLSGAVAAAIVGGDFSGGNAARFGSSIASTQTCRPQGAADAGGTVAQSRRRVGAYG